ncbi:deoxyguanosinetriphosphate triphosphohydrolase [Solicola gregarius]|uniref:Deoxyguanosinetriphosphate triphosphohydrolase-like protein n=1 Tax=Solicola gregarius TaxID=2908642 RepID=A0AA46TIV5_9ACTN|nr:deoxyguanosinetriphosphate triphosphohydrolase [Solicola gregarius]UYM05689.1 deoxyguanosinetriphosphate triphosphohydrolase [Solicola gregarius]
MTEPTYADEARERRVPEPTKRLDRTSFERDRARVLHSAALRRLAAKTQVVGPGTDDFVRNRLTHSLEVAQVARELGKSLGCDPDLVETAALAHDLGHPPFGHNGERALNEAASACGGFEGNAQTLRILARLEPKTFAPDGSSVGLNLTRASLDACVKYPWLRQNAPVPAGSHADGSPRLIRKFGAYDDDLGAFEWLRAGAEGDARCIEAQVMDLSDDIAYCVHDLEDAVVGGRLGLGQIDDDRGSVWDTARDWYVRDATDDSLDAGLARLREMPEWPSASYAGERGDLAVLKSLTSALIGRFAMSARSATRDLYGGSPLTRYAADLVVPSETRTEIAVLKSIVAHYVMRADDRITHLREQRALVQGLVDVARERGPVVLEPLFAADFDAAGDDTARLRVVVDQVASLTDDSALDWSKRLL